MKNVDNLSLFTLTNMTGNTDLSLSAVYSTERRHGPNLHRDPEHREPTTAKSIRKERVCQKMYLWNNFMAEGLILGGSVHKLLPGDTESTDNKPNVTTKERNQRNSNLTFVQFYPTPRSSGSWFCRTKN